MTSHELARKLLTMPDVEVFHFDPSLAGRDEERDTSLSEPQVDYNPSVKFDDPEEGEPAMTVPFIIIASNDDVSAKEESDDLAASTSKANARRMACELYEKFCNEINPLHHAPGRMRTKLRELRKAIADLLE